MSKPGRRKQARTGTTRASERQRAIERVRRRLVGGGWPRLLVSFLLALTGASGFIISTALLHLGVTTMTVRYPLAVMLAYCVFLLLLRLWLALRRKSDDGSDLLTHGGDALPHVLDVRVPTAGVVPTPPTFGGGADFGGAGAGGGWSGGGGAAGSVSADMPGGVPGMGSFGPGTGLSATGAGSSISDYVPDLPDVDLDLDDGCFWIVIPVAAIVGVIVLMFYVVYIAPVFLAEILVDALLLAGLYKRLKGVEQRHWLRSAVGRTLLPALVAAALLIVAGYLMERVAPETRSIGEFWQQVSTGKAER